MTASGLVSVTTCERLRHAKKYSAVSSCTSHECLIIIVWCNNVSLQTSHCPVKKQYILYLDENSLYPAVCYQGMYPWKNPRKTPPKFERLEGALFYCTPSNSTATKHRDSCLPQKINNKCFSTLCQSCAENNYQRAYHHSDAELEYIEVYTTPELRKVVEWG